MPLSARTGLRQGPACPACRKVSTELGIGLTPIFRGGGLNKLRTRVWTRPRNR
jgi:hypothetical protein